MAHKLSTEIQPAELLRPLSKEKIIRLILVIRSSDTKWYMTLDKMAAKRADL
jgi:hypothetical protein